MRPLPRRFYDRNAAEVAPDLIGCLLVRRVPGGARVGRIVETEAYVGPHDLACHSRSGRTARNAVMFGPPGHAYVYLIYGLHRCLNVVCGPGADANAVLIRAAAAFEAPPGPPRRPLRVKPLLHSASGPGNLCKAFGVGAPFDGDDLCGPGARLFVAARPGPAPRIRAGPRVGIDYAGRWVRAPLRFCDAVDPAVSRPRPPGSRR